MEDTNLNRKRKLDIDLNESNNKINFNIRI